MTEQAIDEVLKLDDEVLRRLFQNLLRVRRLDEYGVACLSRGAIKVFWHSAQGHEAVGVGACTDLRADDYLYYHYRGHGLPYLVPKGLDPRLLFAEHRGKVTGVTRSLSAFHVAEPSIGVYGWSGILGVQFGVAAGYGMTAKFNGRQQVAMCFFGDGSANKGQFYESLNLSAIHQTPVVWILENNGLAVHVPIELHHAAPSGTYVDIAEALGLPTALVDGLDVLAVKAAVDEAVARGRAGGGPTFIECTTSRFRAHSEGLPDLSAARPRSDEEIEAARRRDPVSSFTQLLLEHGVLTTEDVETLEVEIREEIDEIERFCETSPEPDPATFDLDAATYAS